MLRFVPLSAFALLVLAGQPVAAFQAQELPPELQNEVWQPAPTLPGGTSWATLGTTKEVTREVDGVIYSTPAFSAQVKALAGKTVKVNGYMMPLQNSEAQTHFVLMAYPPSCPFHMHAGPTQFIEVKSAKPVPFTYDALQIEGTLTLLGEDEGGIFYRIADARPLG